MSIPYCTAIRDTRVVILHNRYIFYLILFRFSPYETLELDSDEGVTPFASVHHCLWFSIASWVQQGCDFLPR